MLFEYAIDMPFAIHFARTPRNLTRKKRVPCDAR